MSYKIFRPKILTAFLAVVVVLLMTTGSLIGAAENGAVNEKENIEAMLPTLTEAESTMMDDPSNIVESEVPLGLEETDGFPEAIIPGMGEAGTQQSTDTQGEMVEGLLPTEADQPLAALVADVVEVQNQEDERIPTGTDQNTFSEGLGYITDNAEGNTQSSGGNRQEQSTSSTESGTRSATLSIILNTDNDPNPGQGLGYLYKSSTGTTYYSYTNYYMRPMKYTTSTTEYRGWAVYDLSDLAKYKGVSITSGYIWHVQDYKYYAKAIEFWTMKSVPYYRTTSPYTLQKGWFDEISGSGSVKLGTNVYAVAGYDSVNREFKNTLTSGGITEINKRLTAGSYDFSMGNIVTKIASGYTYGYTYNQDVRLVLNFSYTGMPDDKKGEVAVGDDYCGYVSSGTKYDVGRMWPYYTSYRSYATWDTKLIKSLIPTQGPGGEKITLKSVSFRINSYYGYLMTLGMYHMKSNPAGASASTIWSDAADGTRYVYLSSGGYQSSPDDEYEWDLGPDALDDFNDTLDGSPNFFALGLSRTSYYSYMYSPRLVIKWKVEYPPMRSIQIGPDNPEYGGDSQGYTYKSGSSYYSTATYYSYPYKTTSGYERHGWAVFDLQDLKKWSGVKVKRAQLVIHMYRNYYGKDYKFTALDTTPYAGMSSANAKKVYDEASSTGTIIGQYTSPVAYDSNERTLVIDLNPTGVGEVNDTLKGSPTYYTFGVGMYVDTIFSGYSSGYARWPDVRLRVWVEYDQELQPTSKGKGIAFGDDWSGYTYKYTTAYDYPYGYAYMRKSSSENRGYYQWNIKKIQDAFDDVNVSSMQIKKLSLRINHWSGSNSITIYDMSNNVTSATADSVFTDSGSGTKYSGPNSVSGSNVEYEWKLSKDAVKNFQDAFEDNKPDYFALGIVASSSGSIRHHGPRLVIEWDYPKPAVVAALTEDPVGFEGTPILFNASASFNLSGGTGGLLYEWDWNNDSVFDQSSKSPLATYTWGDNKVQDIVLRVNDTIAGPNASRIYQVLINNVDPTIDKTGGKITPDPAYEASNVTFSGFKVVDPGWNDSNSTFKYFWDFDGDLEYDVSGTFNGKVTKTIPSETWYYDDDFMGEASLLVLDKDGGSTNVSSKHTTTATPSGMGYVYSSGSKYTSTIMYYWWYYTYDYARGWAKMDLSSIPADATVTRVVFKGDVGYNYSGVEFFAVHLLKSDPVSAAGSTVFSEAGANRLFGLTADVGSKEKDLTKYIQTPTGKKVMEDSLAQGWIGIGTDYERPTNGYRYGYMRNPALDIKYITTNPGCLIPVQVLNLAPVMDCKNLTVTPTSVKEGEVISVSNISFCDVGNDSYEGQIVIGGEYESEWFPLGERPYVAGSGPVKALVAYADTDDDGLGSYLRSDPRFTTVDVINVYQGSIPTLEKLLEYDVVITWTNYPYSDATTFGNNVKDFVDKGGGVVLPAFSFISPSNWPNYQLLGSFISNSYNPIQHTSLYGVQSTSIGNVVDASHPIMKGVTSVNPGFNFYTTTLTAGAKPIFYYANSYIGCAVKEISPGRVVGLNQYPGTDSGTHADLIIANAAAWAGKGQNSSGWGAYGAGCFNINRTFNMTV
ncbi:MAG: hypothetical protein ACYTFW_12305, partial [Planctomycetota bacterium]